MCAVGVYIEKVICTQCKSNLKIGLEESICSKTRDAHQLIDAPTQCEFQLGIKGLAVPRQALSRQGHYYAECCTTLNRSHVDATAKYNKGVLHSKSKRKIYSHL